MGASVSIPPPPDGSGIVAAGGIPSAPDGTAAIPTGVSQQQTSAPQPGWSLKSVLSGTDPVHAAIDRAAQTEPVDTSSFGGFARSVGNNLGAGAVQIFSPLAHPINALEGMARMGPLGDAVDALRGSPTMGQEAAQSFMQNPSGNAVAAIPQAVLAVAGMGGKGSPESIPASPTYAPSHAAAFEGAIAPATGMGKNFVPQDVTPQALPQIRATAARMTQGSPLEQVRVQMATDPSTPPLQRLRAYQGVVQSALNDLEAQHAQGLSSAADVPVDTTPLIQKLRASISPTTDAADASAIHNLMQRVRQIGTIDDLNTFRQELNNETSAEFKQSQIQAGRSGTSVQAASDLASAVRGQYYDDLGKATGVDYAPLKLQESNLLTTKEALQNQMSSLAKQEATFNAPSTLKEKAGNLAGIVQNPKVGVTQILLRESPATRISTLLQKSLADLPPPPNSARMLPAGAPTPMQMPGPPGPQSSPSPAAPIYPGSTASRMGRMLPAPPIELPGAVQQSVPAYSPDTAPARLGRLLPAQSGGPTILPDTLFSPAMTTGEKSAALLQYLRRRQQLQLPEKANPIQLGPGSQ